MSARLAPLILLKLDGTAAALNRCSSTLAGVAATLLIGGTIGPWEMAGAACMCAALMIGARR